MIQADRRAVSEPTEVLAHLREVAEAATPGRWWTEGPEKARHIATFDPPTVKLMLDVIEAAAGVLALTESPTEPAEHLVERVYRNLLAALDAFWSGS